MARPRIIVADDNPAFLQKLVSLLASEFEVVATAADGKLALDLVVRHKPDAVVLDLGVPGLNGIEVGKELAKTIAHRPVVMCSVENDPEIVEKALNAGALGYAFKVRVETDLIPAVQSVLQRKSFVSRAA